MKLFATSSLALALGIGLLQAQVKEPKFRPVTVDKAISIGYGLAVADVDGDGKSDILLADKTQIVWYQNPNWTKHVIAESLTPQDNVCIAARDINGDGKAEIAVGAGWNPGDTINSGAVFYLSAPADRTQKWKAIKLHHEPTVHRMKWIQGNVGEWGLLVVPLHGKGNKNGQGEGVKSLFYPFPKNPDQEWQTRVVDQTLHMTHNFDVVSLDGDPAHEILIGGKEGVFLFDAKGDQWTKKESAGFGLNPQLGAGEVRYGKGKSGNFIAAIEPMHGTNLVIYSKKDSGAAEFTNRKLIDATILDGHALACADLLGLGSDQVVAGWRAMNNKDGAKVGIRIYQETANGDWKSTLLDDNEMACEDLMIADLNSDGKLDVIAAGRATKNVKIYFNETN